MKQGIHPKYVECTVRCTCGNTWVTRSTKSEMTIDLCDKCHPFYTGQQKLVDTGGRVQRFSDKFGGAAAAQLGIIGVRGKYQHVAGTPGRKKLVDVHCCDSWWDRHALRRTGPVMTARRLPYHAP